MTLSNNNFRCCVGHAWTGDALLGARDSEVETLAEEVERAVSILGTRLSGPAETGQSRDD